MLAVKVSDRFLHGCGKDKLLDTLTQGLIDETVTPHRIPALVAAKYEGKEYVVCSNRRLKCYKAVFSVDTKNDGLHVAVTAYCCPRVLSWC